MRSKENTEHLEWVQSHVHTTGLNETLIFNSQTNHMGHRRLLHWGRVLKLRGNRDLLCLLFNDFLLFCKPKHSFTRPVTPSDFEPFGNTQYVIYKQVNVYSGKTCWNCFRFAAAFSTPNSTSQERHF